jgi:hypothetical protein
MAEQFHSSKKKIRNLVDRLAFNLGTYRPGLNSQIDHRTIVTQAADYFSIPLQQVEAEFNIYRAFSDEKAYVQKLGESRTLSFEEAFLIYLSIRHYHPAQIVEIGSQYGKSTRRILDILHLLGLHSQMTCFDILDELKYVSHDEVKLVLHDVTHDFEERVLKLNPGLIFLDAHPYPLLNNVFSAFLTWSQTNPCILAIHDCGPGLYNPHMWISKNRLDGITSRTGVWERHVLSEVFGVANNRLDEVQTGKHHLRIFKTRHGLALITPNHLLSRNI